ncbi:Beta-galactoside alpha-2,6-sialyltransferase 2, partial [Araneus ventricosus]
MYRNVTLIVWDPSKYHGSLEEWYKKPDFDLFSSYWLHREIYPDQYFYILHPEVLWTAWDFIQSNTLVPVEPNPPSSGFLGKVYSEFSVVSTDDASNLDSIQHPSMADNSYSIYMKCGKSVNEL